MAQEQRNLEDKSPHSKIFQGGNACEKRYGILTFHNAHNYGAMLQAYALTTYINSVENCSAEIINYRNPGVELHSHKDFLIDLLAKEGIIGFARWLNRRLITGYYNDIAWNKFHNFLKTEIPVTKRITKENLCLTNYDGYIVGSDQIWNGDLTEGLDKSYFLNFVKENTLKIAYAASSGKDSIDTADATIVELLKKFDYIGVREEGLRQDLSKRLGIRADTVIDPVFLIDATKWKLFVKKPEYTKYLLIYVFNEHSSIYEYAKAIAKERKLQIIVLATRGIKNLGEEFIQIDTCGPEEFISYVYYADYILTSSFHCTAFSIIFEKQFVCIPHPKYHERTDYLLHIAGIQNHSTTNFANEYIDYSVVNKRMSKIIDRSRFFLRRALADNGRLMQFTPFDSKEDCCGCTACAMKCPQKAIVMREDYEGFLYPVIEKGKCIQCNLCLNSCSFRK